MIAFTNRFGHVKFELMGWVLVHDYGDFVLE